MFTISTEVQLLKSVTVTLYPPEESPVKFAVVDPSGQLYAYVPVPPEGTIVASPSTAPHVSSEIIVVETESALAGSEIVMTSIMGHRAASVAVTV